jgi:ectoine hydroxylase-related dioxygenase (phytanoyl-CoA dioxygenase family)
VIHDNDQTIEHFRIHGWMRVRAAFSADEAAAMRTAVWSALANLGIRQSEPSTWTTERPEHLQHVKNDPAFRAVGSARLLQAIDAVLEAQPYQCSKNWGACFLAFPSQRRWDVPSGGWHIDANYLSALSPPAGVRTHALFGDVAPRAGGTLIVSGSHCLVHRYFKDHPPPRGARGADYRRLLLRHPYLRELQTEGDAGERVARFMDSVEEHDGIPLHVVENTGTAGDVILLHPLVLHVATPNIGDAPRFLLSGAIDLPSMWTVSAINEPRLTSGHS